MTLYYSDEHVTLYHGDCLTEHREWLTADVLITDPPYGRNWQSGSGMTNSHGRGLGSKPNGGIRNDHSTEARDNALTAWGSRPAIVFGDLLIQPPPGTRQVCIYAKPFDAGIKGAYGGFRRDAEAIYLVGSWPVQVGGRSSILTTAGYVAGPRGIATRAGHPHAKPIDLLEGLIAHSPPGVVADPFAGSGSTLIAARNLGRHAIGVELEERYCEIIATRLAQGALNFTPERN